MILAALVPAKRHSKVNLRQWSWSGSSSGLKRTAQSTTEFGDYTRSLSFFSKLGFCWGSHMYR
jgi:hypothetical protein